MRPAWPHQLRAVAAAIDAHRRGVRRLVVTIPTGGGKTRVAVDLTRTYLQAGQNVVFYTNRRALIDQAVRDFGDLNFGVRSAGHRAKLAEPFQISSLPTEAARVLRSGEWSLHPAALVIVDECHLHTKATARQILSRHYAAGAMIVGLTATPLDLGDLYDELFTGAAMSELRACGATVPARHFGPDEPDMRDRKPPKVWTEKEAAKVMMREGIFGRVWDAFNELNPDRRPAILFAPGVEQSLWFAQDFSRRGVRAAHIDGADVWVDGDLMRNRTSVRDEILADSKAGRIKVLCNRFVLREGIDCPWLSHGIFATIFGTLQTYLQSGGRLLRGAPGKEFATIQDHGGNWWRHGSLNADQDWRLGQRAEWADELRHERMRANKEPEPWCCPGCHKICLGTACACGYKATRVKYARRVVQQDGELVEHVGKIFQPRRVAYRDDTVKKWVACYHRCRNANRTFRQARALFVKENHYWPPPTLKLMPRDDYTWFLRIKDVAPEKLL